MRNGVLKMNLNEYLKNGKFKELEKLIGELCLKAPKFEGDLELGGKLGTAIADLQEALRTYYEEES